MIERQQTALHAAHHHLTIPWLKRVTHRDGVVSYIESALDFKPPPARPSNELRALRRFYLDELPQLWNLVRGDLSLVGPRPIVPEELALFGDYVPALLSRRPGIFGEWTSRGPERPPYPERVAVEMEYVNDPSVRRGLRIIGRSLAVIWLGQGEGG